MLNNILYYNNIKNINYRPGSGTRLSLAHFLIAMMMNSA